MSLNADALAFLEEKGMSLTDVIELARLMEKRFDSTNAVRQARHRAKRNGSNGVTVTRYGSPNDIDILTPSVPPVISNEMTSPAECEIPEVKPEHLTEAWNATAEPLGLPIVRKMTPERRKKIKTFLRRHGVDDITEGIAAIHRSPFLRGENDRGWRADFDWMLEPRNFTKLTEGVYDR